jgi:hypothetical protein
MEIKAKYLECLKTVVLEMIQDIADNIVVGNTNKMIASTFASFFQTYSEIALMKDSIEVILSKKREIVGKNIEIIGVVLPQIFQKVMGTKFNITIDYEKISEENLENIWNYLNVMLALTEAYKKNP